VSSTRVYGNSELKGQDRIIDLCKREKAEVYINAAGGQLLYEKDVFRNHEISLSFLKPSLNPYPQTGAALFVPGLSIIDLLMNNPLGSVKEQLNHFTLE
jgi:hypothetical protein